MTKSLFAALLLSAISVGSGVAEAACTTDTPVSLLGNNGSNGLISSGGHEYDGSAADGPAFQGSALGQINNDPDLTDGVPGDGKGVAHLAGTSDCASSADISKAVKEMQQNMEQGLATVGALNIPHVERNFAASLNGGFYESETAVGIGAGVRFDKTWQLGGAVAVGTDGGDVAGKAALTGQW